MNPSNDDDASSSNSSSSNSNTAAQPHPPAWRLDPVESMSDFRVVIEGSSAAGLSTTYHVHRYRLCFELRQCHYFVALLRAGGGNFVEQDEVTIQFDHDDVASAFPDFLDYVYTGKMSFLVDEHGNEGGAGGGGREDNDGSSSGTRGKAVAKAIALVHLGKYFVVGGGLVESAEKFVMTKMRRNNLSPCLPLIAKFKKEMPKIRELAIHLLVEAATPATTAATEAEPFCLDEIFAATDDDGVDIDLVAEAMEFVGELTADRSLLGLSGGPSEEGCPASVLAVAFLVRRGDSISREDFDRITGAELMPDLSGVSAKVALQLLDLECRYLKPDDDMSSLQKRSLDAVFSGRIGEDQTIQPALADVQTLSQKIPNAQSAGLFAYAFETTLLKKRRFSHDAVEAAEEHEHHIKIRSTIPDLQVCLKFRRGAHPTGYYYTNGLVNGVLAKIFVFGAKEDDRWGITYRDDDLPVGNGTRLYKHPVVNLKAPPAWGWTSGLFGFKKGEWSGLEPLPPIFVQVCEGRVLSDGDAHP